MKTILHVRFPAAIGALALAMTLSGCTASKPNVDPTSTPFPRVQGTGLDGVERTLPDDWKGTPVVLIVGYVQGTQFDIDRWIVALMQARTPVKIVEVPTIDGLLPTAISDWIDDGMRSGIPAEDWPAVVTVYGAEASRIVAATGDTRPRNARVILLDAAGNVVWFHDRGFSPARLLSLDEAARAAAAGGS